MSNGILGDYQKSSSFNGGGGRATVPVRVTNIIDANNVIFNAVVLHDCEIASAGEMVLVESNKSQKKFANNKSIFIEKAMMGSVDTELLLTNSYRDGDKIIGGYFYLGAVGAKRTMQGDLNSTYSLEAGLMSELKVSIKNVYRAEGEPEQIRWPLNKKSMNFWNGTASVNFPISWMLNKVAHLNGMKQAIDNVSAYYSLAMMDKLFLVKDFSHLQRAAMSAFKSKMSLGVRVGDPTTGDYFFTTLMHDYKVEPQQNWSKVLSKPLFNDLDMNNDVLQQEIFDLKGANLPKANGQPILVIEAFPVRLMRYDKKRTLEALIKKLSDSAAHGDYIPSSGYQEDDNYCISVSKVSNRQTTQGENFVVPMSTPYRMYSDSLKAMGDFVSENFTPKPEVRAARLNQGKPQNDSVPQGGFNQQSPQPTPQGQVQGGFNQQSPQPTPQGQAQGGFNQKSPQPAPQGQVQGGFNQQSPQPTPQGQVQGGFNQQPQSGGFVAGQANGQVPVQPQNGYNANQQPHVVGR